MVAEWRFASRPGDFKIHATISPASRATYSGGATSHDFVEPNATSGTPYPETVSVFLSGSSGRVSVRCHEISVLDVWSGTYVLDDTQVAAQHVLNVT
jgi:hypothetical protein